MRNSKREWRKTCNNLNSLDSEDIENMFIEFEDKANRR